MVSYPSSISHGYALLPVQITTTKFLGLVEAANNFLSRIVPAATKFFEDMENFKDDAKLKVVGEFPVRAIREVRKMGQTYTLVISAS